MKVAAAFFVLTTLLVGGCGPVESTAVISDAQVAISGARSADGPRLAPYEFTSAELYLEKSREERGYADFEVAIEYARKSRDFARQAQSKAMKKVREDVEEGPAPPGMVPMDDSSAGSVGIESVEPR